MCFYLIRKTARIGRGRGPRRRRTYLTHNTITGTRVQSVLSASVCRAFLRRRERDTVFRIGSGPIVHDIRDDVPVLFLLSDVYQNR